MDNSHRLEGQSATADPLVTAVVTTYQRPVLVKRAVRSVLNQNYPSLEVIVVEDGSSTDTEDWLRKQGDSTVKYIGHQTNKGLAAARNTGLEHASGDYIAYLDDDDEWKPGRIKKQIELYSELPASKRDRLGVIYTLYETRYPEETIVADAKEFNEGCLRDAIVRQRRLTPPPSSLLFRKMALRQIGGFDEQLVSSIDHDIWMALADEGYHAYYVDEPLVYNSKEGHETMVTGGSPRIRGVIQFAEKWRPVFRTWMGDEGEEFADRYVARVLAQLSGEKAERGEWKEVANVFRRSFQKSVPVGYNLKVQLDRIGRGIVRRYLERSKRKRIKQYLSIFS